VEEQDIDDDKSSDDDSREEEGQEASAPTNQEDPSKQEAQKWIDSLVDKDVDMDAEFRSEAKTIPAVTLSWMVALLKQKDCKLMTTKAVLKFIGKDFLTHLKERQLFEALTVAELKKLADARGIKDLRSEERCFDFRAGEARQRG
jgi:hypothetical protein